MASCVVHWLSSQLGDPAAKWLSLLGIHRIGGIGKRLRAIVMAALVTQLQSERYCSCIDPVLIE
jgi:hypothetical protein